MQMAIARAARDSRAVETGIWNQYELLISQIDRLVDIGTAVSEVKRDQSRRLDALERNLGEVRDGVQTLIGLLSKDS